MNTNQIFGAISAMIFSLPMSLAIGTAFEPEYERAELRDAAGATNERVGIELKPRRAHDADGLKFVVDADVVEILPKKEGEPSRQVRSADGRELRLLASSRRIALFAAENTEDERKAGRYDLPAEIRRCDLEAALWLPNWKIERGQDRRPEASDADDGGPVLGSVLAKNETVVVLTYDKASRARRTVPPRSTLATSYTLTCYQLDEARPKWSKSYPWLDKRYPPTMPTAGLWGAYDDQIDLLTWVDDKAYEPSIVACAGTKQDVFCLATENGEERWRIPKLWEFERGIIGPSVFEHFVDRFGIDYGDVSLAERTDAEDGDDREDQEKARKRLAESRKKFEDEFDGSIAAGPVFVPDDGSGHVFIATARRRKTDVWQDLGGIALCTVYELEADSGTATFPCRSTDIRRCPATRTPPSRTCLVLAVCRSKTMCCELSWSGPISSGMTRR
jgi:hypothetical protein